MMSDNQLYFIPMIARALEGPDVRNALRKAFDEIKRMGTENRYAEGFENFKLFMQQAYNRHMVTATDHVHELMVHLGIGMFEGSPQEKELLLTMINSHPQWKAEFEAICRMEADENLAGAFPAIEVSSDTGVVIKKIFRKVPSRESFEGIVPGSYRVKLVNTGWTIWQGQFTAKELIWPEGENLLMAAESEAVRRRPTSRKVLLGDEMILCTYTGTESGRIEINLT